MKNKAFKKSDLIIFSLIPTVSLLTYALQVFWVKDILEGLWRGGGVARRPNLLFIRLTILGHFGFCYPKVYIGRSYEQICLFKKIDSLSSLSDVRWCSRSSANRGTLVQNPGQTRATTCPRGSDPFYIVSYSTLSTSWTYSTANSQGLKSTVVKSGYYVWKCT